MKSFVYERDLSATGNKETLVVRAFMAWERKLPKVLSALLQWIPAWNTETEPRFRITIRLFVKDKSVLSVS